MLAILKNNHVANQQDIALDYANQMVRRYRTLKRTGEQRKCAYYDVVAILVFCSLHSFNWFNLTGYKNISAAR